MKNIIKYLAIATWLLLLSPITSQSYAQNIEESQEIEAFQEESGTTWIDILLYVGYILVGIAVVAVVVLPLTTSLMGDVKALVKPLIGLTALVVLSFIFYAMADSPGDSVLLKLGISEGAFRFVDGLLVTTYVLGTVSILSLIYSAVSRVFR